MSILEFIKEALYNHNCVIVPNLGGFLTEEERSSINLVSGWFKPASTNIAFNPSLIKDDGLLKSEICIGLEVSQDTAEEMITAFVAEVKKELLTHKQILLEGLGKLESIDNQLIYSPHEPENFNIEEFGLPDFKIEKIDRNTEDMKKVRPVPAKRVVRRKPIEKTSSSKSVEASKTTKKKESKKENSDSSNRKAIFWILPIILLMGAGAFVGYKFLLKKGDVEIADQSSNSEIVKDQASIVGNLDSKGSEDHTEAYHDHDETSHEVTESVIETASIKEEEIPVKEEKVEEVIALPDAPSVSNVNNGDYHAIMGVFSRKRNAESYASKHSGTVLEIDGMYKVSVASYSSQSKALNDLSNLRTQYGTDIWITKN